MSRGTFCPTTPELPATHTCKLRLHIAIFVSRFTFEPAWNAHWCIYTRSALVRLHEKRVGASTREARWCVYTRSALVRLHEKRVGASTREAHWCIYTRSALVRLHEKRIGASTREARLYWGFQWKPAWELAWEPA